MSFLRHEEIYRSDVRLGQSRERQLVSPPQCSSAAMSFQSAIPWQVALRQSLPPLYMGALHFAVRIYHPVKPRGGWKEGTAKLQNPQPARQEYLP